MTGAPLAGLRVVELASFVAGPSAGMALAQLGADVIRIDPVGGGADYRRQPLADNGESLYWNALNKGKRSIALDLRSERGRQLALSLITAPGADAGVFVDNGAGRRRFSYDELSKHRPDLIHVHIQGHPDGRPAVDYTVNAETGIPSLTGPTDYAGPVNHVLPAWDLLTGMTAATGILAALRHRTATGEGADISLALSDVAKAGLANLGWLAEEALRPGKRVRDGNYLYGSFGTDFTTADGARLMIVALTSGQWRAVQAATGTEQTFSALGKALDTDLADDAERYRHRATIAAVLTPWFAARSMDTIRSALDAARVLWSPYRDVGALVAEHRRSTAPTVLADVAQPGIGTMVAARSPLRWNDAYAEAAPAPTLGEHTHDVLQEDWAGLSPNDLKELCTAGTIAGEHS